MPTIIPSILVPTFDEFARQARRLEGVTDIVQIDVMDGQFVANKSFDEIEKINDLNLKLNWELHLMVAHPLEELEKWTEIKNIQRVIFHIESLDDPKEVVAHIRGKCWGAGIALNPETPLSAIEPYVDLVDVVLFMTVHPGQQGAKFLPEVGEKMKKFITTPHPLLRKEGTDTDSPLRRGRERGGLPLIAVDGGVNENNIALIKSWGVDIFGVGSAISQARDVKEAYKKLNLSLRGA